MLKAVIFDFDGVITDSEILHLRAFNDVLAAHGIEIKTKDYYNDYLGMTDMDCFSALAEEGRLKLDRQGIVELIRKKNLTFEVLAKTEGRIIEGVRDFVQMLRQNEITMAICSGALLVEIRLILDEAALGSFFDVIVSAEQVKKGKPNPEGFLLTLVELNETAPEAVAANECIVIEDSHWGLDAAVAAGMHTIAVTNSYEAEQLTGAEKVVARIDEVTLEQLQAMCA